MNNNKPPEKISEDDVLWLLSHESEFTIEFSGTSVSIECIYKEIDIITDNDTGGSEWIRTGFILTIDGENKEIRTVDETIEMLRKLMMPAEGIDLIRYEVWNEYYRYNTDTEDRSFYSDFRNARKKADFIEIDMNGLLDRYMPMADSIKLTVFAFDPKGLPKSDFRKRPGKVRHFTERFEKLRDFNESPFEALAILQIPQLKDSFKRAIFRKMNDNTDIYECHIFFGLTEDVISWMRTFDNDYEMGDFEDLCFFSGKKQLYDSVSHEHMRFDLVDTTVNH